uniref:Reverse transcriptase zinc-binding domain-containing protein n=1 Tax=Setaria viridis TaxID=4556 RepID=A0A4U6VI08_SETVI|nr:hypothetical protein SEVIR_3G325900v2 [Setaria viridis]
MILPSYSCVLCLHDKEETLFHLLLECPFAQECWIHQGLFMDLQQEPYSILSTFKHQLQVVPFFMEVIIIISWCIWMTRNDWIFNGIHPTIQGTIIHFKHFFTLVIHRVKDTWKQPMFQWLDQSL